MYGNSWVAVWRHTLKLWRVEIYTLMVLSMFLSESQMGEALLGPYKASSMETKFYL